MRDLNLNNCMVTNIDKKKMKMVSNIEKFSLGENDDWGGEDDEI